MTIKIEAATRLRAASVLEKPDHRPKPLVKFKPGTLVWWFYNSVGGKQLGKETLSIKAYEVLSQTATNYILNGGEGYSKKGRYSTSVPNVYLVAVDAFHSIAEVKAYGAKLAAQYVKDHIAWLEDQLTQEYNQGENFQAHTKKEIQQYQKAVPAITVSDSGFDIPYH